MHMLSWPGPSLDGDPTLHTIPLKCGLHIYEKGCPPALSISPEVVTAAWWGLGPHMQHHCVTWVYRWTPPAQPLSHQGSQ